jgi:hypothetical protein
VRIAWFNNEGEQKHPFNYFSENSGQYINTTKESLNCVWVGNTLKVKDFDTKNLAGNNSPANPPRNSRNSSGKGPNWVLEGEMPEPCVMMLEIIRLLQYPDYVYNPSSSPWVKGKIKGTSSSSTLDLLQQEAI